MTIGVTPKINLPQAATDIWIDGFNTALEAERERIIELLDTLATQEPDYAQVFIHNLKVLIKGENK